MQGIIRLNLSIASMRSTIQKDNYVNANYWQITLKCILVLTLGHIFVKIAICKLLNKVLTHLIPPQSSNNLLDSFRAC